MSVRQRVLAVLLAVEVLVVWWTRPEPMHGIREDGPRMDGWHAYDYRRGLAVEPPVNIFEPAVPVGNGVRVDDSMWSIDDPESPPSVLALVRYHEWEVRDGRIDTVRTKGDDLRGRCVTFDLRGNVDLSGGHLTFWVMSPVVGQRWHVVEALPDPSMRWATVQLRTGEVEWRRSWASTGQATLTFLEETLAMAGSYGVGVVGFDEEPAGWLELRGFRLGC